MKDEPTKWATAFIASRSVFLSCRTLRALGFLAFVILGFRFAPPQALCFHPLRGFGTNVRRHHLFTISFSLSLRSWRGSN